MKWMKLLLLALTVFGTACAQDKEKDVFTTPSGKNIEIYAIKHGSIRIVFDGKEIEVDPVSVLDPVTDYAAYPKADFILITHEHFDHFDKKAIHDLSASTTRIITNQRVKEMLGRGEAMANGDSIQLADNITLKAVPAYNTTPSKMQFHPKGRDNGYVITLGGFRIYVAGDTECIDEMGQLKDIDIAFLPTNLPFTMTPEQTSHAAGIINPKVLFPYHYGKTDIQQVAKLLEPTSIDVRIRHYE